MKKTITQLSIVLAAIFIPAAGLFAQSVNLQHLGTYYSDVFDESAAEIVAYEKSTEMLFVINANDVSVDVIDISDPTSPTLDQQINMSSYGGSANSVAIMNGIVAVAVENNNKQANGVVVFLDSAGNYINDVNVGALPDMVTFTPDGNYVLCANEGEPSDDYLNDPEGTISIIDISNGVGSASVTTATFTSFNANPPSDPSVRNYGNNGAQTFAQDMEPEYITVSSDSKTAYVSLQENNAIAVVDIENATVTDIFGLGFKDHSQSGKGLDPSDRDDKINIQNYPVFGIPLPDAIASYDVGGTTYIVTANEGDAREYAAYEEEDRVKDLDLDTVAFPNYAELQEDTVLGRLTITLTLGDTDNDGDYEELYCLGTRSFSIYDESGSLVFDSDDDFEQITAQDYPDYFNANNDENDSFESRSDNKGPEPEGVAIAEIEGKVFAFIGLERIGGIMVYDVTDPANSTFVQYINNRDFTQEDTSRAAGDLGPEGLVVIHKDDSPNGEYLLAVGNEVSGTTSIFQIDVVVGIEENGNNSSSIKVFPNPSNGDVIYFSEKISGSVFDVTGKQVLSFNNRITINTNQLKDGFYFIRTLEGEELKMIIQR